MCPRMGRRAKRWHRANSTWRAHNGRAPAAMNRSTACSAHHRRGRRASLATTGAPTAHKGESRRVQRVCNIALCTSLRIMVQCIARAERRQTLVSLPQDGQCCVAAAAHMTQQHGGGAAARMRACTHIRSRSLHFPTHFITPLQLLCCHTAPQQPCLNLPMLLHWSSITIPLQLMWRRQQPTSAPAPDSIDRIN